MTSQFILCVLMFFMCLRLPVQNAFKNGYQHSTTELRQKQKLPFYDISVVVQKNMVFLDIIEQFGTRPRSRNTIILLVTRPLPKTHCGD